MDMPEPTESGDDVVQELTGYGTTNYQNGLLGVERETLAGGAVTAYTRQPDGTPVAQRTTTSKQYLFGDQLGSITALADDNANSLTRTYAYDPDGNRTSTGTGANTDLGHAGGLDPPNNLYHYGARFYDPSTAHWTQQDPLNAVASAQNANRYTYAAGNPINEVDDSGEVGCATFGLGHVCQAAGNLAKHPAQTAAGAGSLALGGTVFSICAVGGGEVDIAAHCVLAAGPAVTSGGVLLATAADDDK
jgi:RHS repeat-associated protein